MQIAETFPLNYKPKLVKFYLKLKSLITKVRCKSQELKLKSCGFLGWWRASTSLKAGTGFYHHLKTGDEVCFGFSWLLVGNGVLGSLCLSCKLWEVTSVSHWLSQPVCYSPIFFSPPPIFLIVSFSHSSLLKKCGRKVQRYICAK